MNHRKIVAAAVGAALLLTAVAGCTASTPSKSKHVITISYETLAFQKPSVAANKALVKSWNKEHPDIQVKYIQGDWGSIGDQLTTGFQAGTAPDVFHFYDSGLQGYAKRGDLLNLAPYLSSSFTKDILPNSWKNVSFNGIKGVWGVPFLQEPTLIYANADLLKKAGISIPDAAHPWTWADYQNYAKQLTIDKNGDGETDQYGAAIPLKSGGVDLTISLGLSYGAQYLNKEGTAVQWGAAEQKVPTRLHDMLYVDKSMSTEVLGFGNADTLPEFFSGKFATIFGGTFLREQIKEGAPAGFNWVALPPLVGKSQAQSDNAQTISVSAQTKHPKEATEFLQYLLNPKHQVELAAGDAETPTSIAAGKILAKRTTDGWKTAIAASKSLVFGNFQASAGYGEWESKVANQAFADYYSNKISIAQLQAELRTSGDPILARAATGK